MRHAEALYSGNKLSVHYYMVIKYVRDKINDAYWSPIPKFMQFPSIYSIRSPLKLRPIIYRIMKRHK